MNDVITRYGYIYKITNNINNKIYIGKKVGNTFDETYWGSGTKLKNAIKEFGIHNFTKEVIEWCSTMDILRDRERYWIKCLNSRDPNIGYNIKKGREDRKLNSHNQETTGSSIISLQLPNFVIDWLKEKSNEECTSVSGIIRKILIKEKRSSEDMK